MQQKIAQKEKESKEENLRMLAQRAREERSGIASGSGAGPARVGGATGGAMPSALAGYGSDSDEEETSEREEMEEEDEAAAKEREEIRRERKKEREREMRMSNMGTEQRAKILARLVIFLLPCLYAGLWPTIEG
jgi:SNW domain-containing protein 1